MELEEAKSILEQLKGIVWNSSLLNKKGKMQLFEAIDLYFKKVEVLQKENEAFVKGRSFTKKQIEIVKEVLKKYFIPKKKIENILKKLDSKKVEERIIKFYTPDKKHYYETDKYNDIIKQFLQKLLEDK